MSFPDCDLRRHPPRAARVQIGGLYFLARTIDKARAKLAGTLGEYKISPGISGYMFDDLEISEDDFVEAVRNAHGDEDVIAWLHAHTDRSKYPEINEKLYNRRLRDAEHRASFADRYPILNERPDLWNWFEIFDVDDEWMFRPENRGKPGAAARVPA
jgi:hypothetical protein